LPRVEVALLHPIDILVERCRRGHRPGRCGIGHVGHGPTSSFSAGKGTVVCDVAWLKVALREHRGRCLCTLPKLPGS
jgi:hypothetical protein